MHVNTALSVNVNKIAWLRNARDGSRPDLIAASRKIVEAGAAGITVHPRPDLRHIRPDDVYEIISLTAAFNVEFNIEGNPLTEAQTNRYPGFMQLVRDTCPTQCTLVPDTAHQLTSDHGWDLQDSKQRELVSHYVNEIHDIGCRTSIFVEADPDMVTLASETQTDRIELFTGPWAKAVEAYGIKSGEAKTILQRYSETAELAIKHGLEVNAGHDLDLHNITEFVGAVLVKEVSIGHALVADALDFGLNNVVQKYLDAINQGTKLRESKPAQRRSNS